MTNFDIHPGIAMFFASLFGVISLIILGILLLFIFFCCCSKPKTAKSIPKSSTPPNTKATPKHLRRRRPKKTKSSEDTLVANNPTQSTTATPTDPTLSAEESPAATSFILLNRPAAPDHTHTSPEKNGFSEETSAAAAADTETSQPQDTSQEPVPEALPPGSPMTGGPSGFWQQVANDDHCSRCGILFTVWTRRHHCRYSVCMCDICVCVCDICVCVCMINEII